MAEQDTTGARRLPGPRSGQPAQSIWDVKVEIHLVVRAADQNKAENLVLDLMENHLGDMLDCPQVMATSLRMDPDNPSSQLASQGG